MKRLCSSSPLALVIGLGLVTAAGESGTLPYSDEHLRDFEQRFCYDRFWTAGGAAPPILHLAGAPGASRHSAARA